jgi:hypothetical protein
MSKYDPLQQFLRRKRPATIELSFTDIERIIGAPLPKRSSDLAWWREPDSNPRLGGHQQAWLQAGYVAEPLLAEERVRFSLKTSDDT